MSDNVLDDFFAKKDKKKRSKSKFTTTDAIAKNMEDGGGKKTDPVKKEFKEKVPLSSNNSGATEHDDEWKNIDDEKERDYSGLRIQALSMSEKEKEEEQLKEQQMAEQNGEMCKIQNGQSGPWKMVATPPSPPPEIEEEHHSISSSELKLSTSTEEIQEDAPVKKPAAYKPPQARSAPPSNSSSNTRKHPKSAPQITSEIHFPSLASALNSFGNYGDMDQSFQSVKHGIKSKSETQHGLQLDLENKFSALHQGDHV